MIETAHGEKLRQGAQLDEPWHKKQLNTPSEGVWERRADLGRSPYARLRRRARKRIFDALFSIPGSTEWLRRQGTGASGRPTTTWRKCGRRSTACRPDAALSLTPFLTNEEMAMRVCEERGIPLCTSLLSFDNVTTRGWWAVRFDRYMVWNRYNAEELLRSHPEISPSEVDIVGAPQFDFY